MRPWGYLPLFVAAVACASDGVFDEELTEFPDVTRFETVSADEPGQITELWELLAAAEHPSHDRRNQHQKGTACVAAKFTVRGDIPDDLSHGVFADATTYDCYIRLSNGLTEKDDEVDVVHGLAIKLVGVEGEKLLRAESSATTQDFIFTDEEVFFSPDLEGVLGFASGSPGPRIGAMIKASQAKTGMLRSPVSASYFSQTPYLLGDAPVKYRLDPVGHGDAFEHTTENDGQNKVVAVVRVPVDHPAQLKEQLAERLANHDRVARRSVRFAFSVQRYVDEISTPVEDATRAWPTEFVPVAEVVVPPQCVSYLDEIGERLAFTPWHALPEHRPLGTINRARRAIYEAGAQRRHELKGDAYTEPTEVDFDALLPTTRE